jgi:uncharacterized protein (DUF1800 family)
MLARLSACGLIAALCVAAAPQMHATAPADDEQRILHVLNRVTYGPRSGDVERVKAIGVDRWIEMQLTPSRIDNRALDAKLASLATLHVDSRTIQRDYAAPAALERRARRAAEGTDQKARAADGAEGRGQKARAADGTDQNARAAEGTESTDQRTRAAESAEITVRGMQGPPSEAIRRNRQVLTDLEQAKLLRAVYSERQLEEVLVDFWFNHFNVFAGKGVVRNYIGEYERDAIRPYVLGNFREMLGATAKSPAMLFYLDNWLSSAQGAKGAQGAQGAQGARGAQGASGARPTARRSSGLNENYARELLELHTLGVDGGYTQQDIVNVARAFTGWSMRPRQGTGFIFVASRHDRGEKIVLGHTIKAGGGIDDGERVLDLVAAHPATAKHIATSLAVRFVSDAPPQALVDRLAAAFASTNGDLRAVMRALLNSPEFLSPEEYRVKVKTPFEFVASALRATGADVRVALPLAKTLKEMGMPLYFCQPPTGYDDTSTAWVNAGALVSRMNFAVDLSKNAIRGTRVPLSEAQAVALDIGAPGFQRR